MTSSITQSWDAVRAEPINFPLSTDQAIAAFGGQSCPAILESLRNTGGYGRYSIFAANPIQTLSIPASDREQFHHFLKEIGGKQLRGSAKIPFGGGWIGYLGYEAGLGLENVPRVENGSLGLPELRMSLYDATAVYDHAEKQWYATAIEWPSDSQFRGRSVQERLESIALILNKASQISPRDSEKTPNQNSGSRPILASALTKDQYLDRVRRIQELILDGEVYQVNLTQRWQVDLPMSPLEIYQKLRNINPSPYGAFLQWPDAAIISSSPELFLDVREKHVVTRPIKGTRPRGGDFESDHRLRRELEASEKDRAELNMIVDVLRNDLGRVCEIGSVKVRSAGEIEEHPTVFHRVATIEGRLRGDCELVDLILAAFPGGSVTGAPKIRAMQVISELEPTPRGVYCGAIGWIGLDGSMTLNLAIRTMIATRDKVYLHAGGGITIDSDPEDEYREMLTKLRAMAKAVGTGIEHEF
ncbi:MAG: aminodeoxychorismate synthase component I [Planctomycetes bacterium]|nr:aminodeoxychorismate synthase component I [Planctomycetota bacterium]